jgi:hypothetical protein
MLVPLFFQGTSERPGSLRQPVRSAVPQHSRRVRSGKRSQVLRPALRRSQEPAQVQQQPAQSSAGTTVALGANPIRPRSQSYMP